MAQDKYHVILMNTPPQRVFAIRKNISIAEVHDLFQALSQEMQQKGLTRTGATQLIYHGKTFSYENMDAEAQVQVSGEAEGVLEVPEQLCAVTTHIGPYDSIKYAYDAICGWLEQHPEYQMSGPPIERYLKDENTVSSPEDLETGILFPVVKK